LIDFGIARQLRHHEVDEFDELLQKAEAGNCDELRLKLTKLEPQNNKCLHKLIFRPRWVGHATIKSGITKYPTLAPAIKLTEKVALEYKAGLTNPTSTLPDRKGLSVETIAENKRIEDERYAQIKAERTAENEMERPEESARKKTRCEKEVEEKGYCSVMGGKRRTKYVGTRKRFRTRRKVQNRSL